MSPAARVAFGIAVVLLIVALHTVSVGYDSYTPLVFAQLYITFFAFVMMIPTLRRTGRSEAGDHLTLVIVAAAVGLILGSLAGFFYGGSTYCGGEYLLDRNARVPTRYRCTAAPMGVAGWFAGWWLTIWLIECWKDRATLQAKDAARTWSLLVRVAAVIAVVILILASRRLFVGATSFGPILAAEMYIALFTLVLATATLVRTEALADEPDWFLLIAGAGAGAVIAWMMAPVIGEPNYCMPLPVEWRLQRQGANDIAQMLGRTPPYNLLRPTTFRCTSLPLILAGGFAGWWIALFANVRWRARQSAP